MDTLENIYTDATLRKGESLAANLHAVQRDAQDESIWWVKGSTGSKYRVQLYDDPEHGGGVPMLTCSCPNGMHRGGRPTCYHTAAVLIILRDGKVDEHPVMTNPDPLDENFIHEDEIQELRRQGYSDDEIEFLRS